MPSDVKTVNPGSGSHSLPVDSDSTTAEAKNNGATKWLRINDAKSRKYETPKRGFTE